jgi:NAD(P)-dependent dehydrogenase (short-subunit alcohol dehydrogenase family)
MTILDRFRLDNKRAFITGGSRGLGLAMATALAEAGADIVLAGRDQASLEAAADTIRGLGREAWTIEADMADPATCETTAERVAAEHGPIDILINNIGGRRDPRPTTELPLATWQALIDLNLTSTFLCTKIIGGAMVARGQGGRVINISSINAMVAGKDIGGRHYETAKAAVLQFTRATAADWAPHGVTVNAICPGLFMTEANARWSKEKPEVIDGIVARTPMATTGQPEDLGALAVYLASDASRFMTGAALVIDGGYTLW